MAAKCCSSSAMSAGSALARVVGQVEGAGGHGVSRASAPVRAAGGLEPGFCATTGVLRQAPGSAIR